MRNLTEVSTYTANVQVPENGDVVAAETHDPAFQALANRTKYLRDHVDALEARFDASGQIILPSTLDVARYVGIHKAQGHSPTTGLDAWTRWNDHMRSEEDRALLRWDITSELPQAAELAFVAVLVEPGTARAGANRMQVAIERGDVPFDIATPSRALAVVGTAPDDSSGMLQWILCVPASPPVAISTGQTWQVAVVAGADAATNKDRVYGLYLRYGVASLRNV